MKQIKVAIECKKCLDNICNKKQCIEFEGKRYIIKDEWEFRILPNPYTFDDFDCNAESIQIQTNLNN